MEIKIISYNMYKGKKVFSNKYIFNKMTEALHFLDPDILMIQEFPGQNPKKSKEAIDPIDCLRSDIFEHSRYGMNSSYAQGHHGNLILSKYPILESLNIDISEMRLANRGLLYAKIELPCTKKHLNVLCSHLDLLGKARKKQIVKIFELIDRFAPMGEPFVLGGDFNDWNKGLDKIVREKFEHSEPGTLQHQKNLHKTYPSVFPILPLDRFYCRGLKTVKIEVLKGKPWNRLSDHLPLMLTGTFDVK